MKVPVDSVASEKLPGFQMTGYLLIIPSHGREGEGKKAFWSLLTRALISARGPHLTTSSKPNYPSKSSTLKTPIALGVRASK